jgi:hypothetical protein
LIDKWKKDLAVLKKQWRAWIEINRPFFEEHERRARAFAIGVVKGEAGKQDALQTDAPGNEDTKGEALAFAMGCAAGPILRARLWALALELIAGAKAPDWLREIIKAMLESIIPKK